MTHSSTLLVRRNARAFTAGQFARDTAEPECREDWLETREGDSWLEGAIGDLIGGRTIEGISHEQFVAAIDDQLVANIDWEKTGPFLAILLADILKNDLHPQFNLANQLLGGSHDRKVQPVRELAKNLLIPKGADVCRRQQEEDFY